MGSGISVAAQSQMRAMGLYLSALGVVCCGSHDQPLVRPLSSHKPAHLQKNAEFPGLVFYLPLLRGLSFGGKDVEMCSMVTPLDAVRVHTEDLQEGHNGKGGENSLLIKPGREVLMNGAKCSLSKVSLGRMAPETKSNQGFLSRWHALNPAWSEITTTYPGVCLLQ